VTLYESDESLCGSLSFLNAPRTPSPRRVISPCRWRGRQMAA
jgi:hypothetical protein